MARRQTNRLTAKTVAAAKRKGMYADGEGLYLQVAGSGSRSWIFRYSMDGKTRDMGLGSASVVTLAEAREKAQEARRLKAKGIDPISAAAAERAAKRVDGVTFRQVAEAYVAAHRAGWRNPKHVQQWENTLAAYCYPAIGDLPIASIDTAAILAILGPQWQDKTETLNRLRGRIEAILDYARALKYRDGENPARWRGHLAKLLPARRRVQRIKHHPSMPYAGAPAFYASLTEKATTAAAALRFAILTAARTSEAIEARWSEIDLAKAEWTIPAERMKGNREHKVPLSPQAVELLRGMIGQHKEFVFVARKSRPLSNGAFLVLLGRMGHGDITAHGFRSTFRNWAAEQTTFPREIAEASLAHVNSDRVESSYLHTDFFAKRRDLLGAWARYLTGGTEPTRLTVAAE